MAEGVYNILKGRFLTSEDAFKNWRFLAFMIVLAMIMIYTGHSLERKVFYMSQLNDRSKTLRSEYRDGQKRLMRLQMESSITRRLKNSELSVAPSPPEKIIVTALPKSS